MVQYKSKARHQSVPSLIPYGYIPHIQVVEVEINGEFSVERISRSVQVT